MGVEARKTLKGSRCTEGLRAVANGRERLVITGVVFQRARTHRS